MEETYKGKKVHFIGIGGSSMSGLAMLLQKTGCVVSGSDRDRSHKTDKLQAMGIPVAIGQRAENITDAELVVYTAAIAPDNPERVEAAKRGIPMLERAELIGRLMDGYNEAIGVSGTHGKTTTTAMLAQVLVECGEKPTVHIGGELDAIGGSTLLGEGDIFLCESCEFAGSFLKFRPSIAVILNIDEDHLDFYGDIEHIEEAFYQFTQRTPGTGWVIGCGDDERVRRVLGKCDRKTRTYGISPFNDVQADMLTYDEEGRAAFTATLFGHPLCEVTLAVPGEHNVRNALAAIACCGILELPMSSVAESLGRFHGAHRRFEQTATVQGVELFTDYGHNPEEIKNALSIAKKHAKGRLIAVWQPHTYSRTKNLYDGFLTCFEEADVVVVTDIMGAREIDPGDIHSSMLVNDMQKAGKQAFLTPTFDDAEQFLRGMWKEGDLVITLGCGNIDLLNEQIEKHEQEKASH